jgi:hypothetical protein
MRGKAIAISAICLSLTGASSKPVEAFFWDSCDRHRNGFSLYNSTFSNPNGSVNGWCQNYRKVILTRGDLVSLRSAARNVRNRIQANDLTYLCLCEGFNHPLCGQVLTRF